jgi:hypothetical protein
MHVMAAHDATARVAIPSSACISDAHIQKKSDSWPLTHANYQAQTNLGDIIRTTYFSLGLMHIAQRIAVAGLLAFAMSAPVLAVDQHAVIVHLKLAQGGFGSDSDRQKLFELEERVAAAVARSRSGEHDGNEIGGGEFIIYCYGPNADTLYQAIEPILRASTLSKGALVIVRYGPPGARQRDVRL